MASQLLALYYKLQAPARFLLKGQVCCIYCISLLAGGVPPRETFHLVLLLLVTTAAILEKSFERLRQMANRACEPSLSYFL